MIKLGKRRGANVIRIIVDKPQHLPKPSDLLYEKRTGKTGKLNVDECKISASEAIPQCSKYR